MRGFGELSESGFRERGITLNVAAASQILAPAGGVINYAGKYRNFGHIVIIQHGGGWTSLITNMASLNVTKGHKISQGGVVGMAKNGDSNITIELRRNDRAMDIMAIAGQ